MRTLIGIVVAGLLAACGPASEPRAESKAPTDTPAPVLPTATQTPSAASGADSTPPAPEPEPWYRGSISAIDAATRARMTHSWRAGCPVPIRDLRLVSVRHWGFDGRVYDGELVVHRDAAGAVIGVFRSLFEARFPIRRMRLVDEYGGDDDRSMAANNSSGFNCRRSSGDSGAWSEHAYGRAIDINPVQNPYVSGGAVEPPSGRPYVDRSVRTPGLIRPGDVVVRAFASIGWRWGGTWSRSKDYQHFSRSGR